MCTDIRKKKKRGANEYCNFGSRAQTIVPPKSSDQRHGTSRKEFSCQQKTTFCFWPGFAEKTRFLFLFHVSSTCLPCFWLYLLVISCFALNPTWSNYFFNILSMFFLLTFTFPGHETSIDYTYRRSCRLCCSIFEPSAILVLHLI